MTSSNGASTRRLLWKNLFTFRKCSTYLSKNIGFTQYNHLRLTVTSKFTNAENACGFIMAIDTFIQYKAKPRLIISNQVKKFNATCNLFFGKFLSKFKNPMYQKS